MTETAIGEKLRRAGVNELENSALADISRWMNNGMTEDRAVALVRSAYAMRGEGQISVADKATGHLPSAPHTNGDGRGHPIVSREGQHTQAPSSPHHREREGRIEAADKATVDVPPAREPSAAAKRAMVEVRKAISVSIMDTFKVRDGRSIGEVRFGELEAMRGESARDAFLFRQLQKHAANADPSARVRDVVKVETLQRMLQKSAELADAA
jgi:hypothetical protein